MAGGSAAHGAATAASSAARLRAGESGALYIFQEFCQIAPRRVHHGAEADYESCDACAGPHTVSDARGGHTPASPGCDHSPSSRRDPALSAAHRNCLASLARGTMVLLQVIW